MFSYARTLSTSQALFVPSQCRSNRFRRPQASMLSPYSALEWTQPNDRPRLFTPAWIVSSLPLQDCNAHCFTPLNHAARGCGVAESVSFSVPVDGKTGTNCSRIPRRERQAAAVLKYVEIQVRARGCSCHVPTSASRLADAKAWQE